MENNSSWSDCFLAISLTTSIFLTLYCKHTNLSAASWGHTLSSIHGLTVIVYYTQCPSFPCWKTATFPWSQFECHLLYEPFTNQISTLAGAKSNSSSFPGNLIYFSNKSLTTLYVIVAYLPVSWGERYFNFLSTGHNKHCHTGKYSKRCPEYIDRGTHHFNISSLWAC